MKVTPRASLWAYLLSSCTYSASAQREAWSDQFDETSTRTIPNDSMWTYEIGGDGWGNNELQYYTSRPSNVALDGGYLKLVAREQHNEAGARHFTSGRIATKDRLEIMYADIEIRMKIPDLNAGLSPFIRAIGYDVEEVGWLEAGEITMLEMGEGTSILQGIVNNRVTSGAHWKGSDGGFATYDGTFDSPVDMSQDFHTYRMTWNDDYIRTYVDGTKIWEMRISKDVCPHCSAFHKPHYLTIGLAVGGGFTDVNPATNRREPEGKLLITNKDALQ